MRILRRLTAPLAIVAVTWTALWPLVSTARLAATDQAMPLCHQAGTQVSPDQAPMDPGAPAEGKQHCPLCIMAFFVAHAAPVTGPIASATAVTQADGSFWATTPAGIHTRTPQSRAPPPAP
ncbi:MAG TPA: DUF2946 family protein [Usitatibacter sp.]|nr:DUF2946 family protein [Usitatibacter sp.]